MCLALAACGEPVIAPDPAASAPAATPQGATRNANQIDEPVAQPAPAAAISPSPAPSPVPTAEPPVAVPPSDEAQTPAPADDAGPEELCSTRVPTPCEFSVRSVSVLSAGGRSSEIRVEVADTPALRSRGLMFRSELPDDEGMLFEYGHQTSGGFWMRNTYVGLDIAFLDAEGVILAILPGEPESLETVSPDLPYWYALEVNRGWFERMGFGPGDRVAIDGVAEPEPLPTPVRTPQPQMLGPAAAQLLNELDVLPEHDSDYDRADWPHWNDLDGDGCDTRCEVLAAERRPDGSWFSAFDGRSTTTPGEFDIDHLVPLAEAHESGGWQWDRTTRRGFANDEAFPHSLIAVSASSNRSKGKKDPAEWLPPATESHCFYADAWVRIKHRWSLSVDVAELIALGRILADCPEAVAVPVPPAQVTTATPEPESESAPADAGAAQFSIASCDAGGELVVLTGPAGSALAGWTLHDEGSRNAHEFSTGTRIPASGSLVIASGRASGDIKPWGGRNVWNNDGDTATLLGPDGSRISLRCS